MQQQSIQIVSMSADDKFVWRYNSTVDPTVEEAFDRRIPYDYLQLCAYKVIFILDGEQFM